MYTYTLTHPIHTACQWHLYPMCVYVYTYILPYVSVNVYVYKCTHTACKWHSIPYVCMCTLYYPNYGYRGNRPHTRQNLEPTRVTAAHGHLRKLRKLPGRALSLHESPRRTCTPRIGCLNRIALLAARTCAHKHTQLHSRVVRTSHTHDTVVCACVCVCVCVCARTHTHCTHISNTLYSLLRN